MNKKVRKDEEKEKKIEVTSMSFCAALFLCLNSDPMAKTKLQGKGITMGKICDQLFGVTLEQMYYSPPPGLAPPL